ncbi:MAG: hypothetical protein NXH95_16370 [Pseudomonadaceae bacterium]|nr:hypothetical protein [Pseudomonadaceae bacterium]
MTGHLNIINQDWGQHLSSVPSALTLFFCLLLVSGCAGTKQLAIDTTFPVPVIEKAPVSLGIFLDDTLVNYAHKETIDQSGTWEVQIGQAQTQLFTNLATGLFESYTFVSDNTVAAPMDGVLKPNITEVQFSVPAQTRSDYYEVWVRYEFELYDREGNVVGSWKLPAYGKASKNNHGSSSNGLQAAAIAACRDAMAFFSINFTREPAVQKWLAAGKPSQPAPVMTTETPAVENNAETTANSQESDPA